MEKNGKPPSADRSRSSGTKNKRSCICRVRERLASGRFHRHVTFHAVYLSHEMIYPYYRFGFIYFWCPVKAVEEALMYRDFQFYDSRIVDYTRIGETLTLFCVYGIHEKWRTCFYSVKDLVGQGCEGWHAVNYIVFLRRAEKYAFFISYCAITWQTALRSV